jgi:hypothetical protein
VIIGESEEVFGHLFGETIKNGRGLGPAVGGSRFRVPLKENTRDLDFSFDYWKKEILPPNIFCTKLRFPALESLNVRQVSAS